MDQQQLVDLIVQKKWIALMALAIGLVVRLLKSDTKIPIDIPPQWRVWLALGLAPIAGAIDHVAAGTTWTTAMVEGVIAAVMAIVGHATVIDSMRGGKEFVVPGLIKTNTPPGPGKPPSIPPGPEDKKFLDLNPPQRRALPCETIGHKLAPVLAFGLVFLTGCALFQGPNGVKNILALKDIACIAEHAFLDNAALDTACDMLSAEQKEAAHQAAAAHRTAMAKQMATRASACGDAGADAALSSAGTHATSTRADVDGGNK